MRERGQSVTGQAFILLGEQAESSPHIDSGEHDHRGLFQTRPDKAAALLRFDWA